MGDASMGDASMGYGRPSEYAVTTIVHGLNWLPFVFVMF
jgi:hypothetical protein